MDLLRARRIATEAALDEECRLSVGPVDVDALREKIKTFWKKNEPSKLHKLDECMERFKGKEHRLVMELEDAEAKVAQFGSLEAAQKAELSSPPAPIPANPNPKQGGVVARSARS